MDSRAFTVAEAAALLGIGRSTIYVAIKDGRLKTRKLGKRTLVLREDLDAFLAALPTG